METGALIVYCVRSRPEPVSTVVWSDSAEHRDRMNVRTMKTSSPASPLSWSVALLRNTSKMSLPAPPLMVAG